VSSLIEQTIAEIQEPRIPPGVQERWDSLTKPRGSLGRLESSVAKLAAIQATAAPRIERRAIYVFCGDHGITEESVSPYPSVVTREMVKNFTRGGAAINVLCRRLQIETHIIDSGVSGPKLDHVLDRRIAPGTANFLRAPAMSREQAIASLETGIQLASSHYDIAGVGEMGIGNSTPAAALLCAFTGVSPQDAVGRGAGLDDAGLQHKCDVVSAALSHHNTDPRDPLSVVSAFAGFEIAMMAGFLLGAGSRRLPVVVDGFIAGAAFLIARAFHPQIADHLFFAHHSAERGHSILLTSAKARPLLDLEMCLGEGTGAALAIDLLTSAVHLYREMATFAEASISDQTKEHSTK
jgi:nicotinate-nucleotide--dimethylbenzimidazole phosphoribosyltransferase